MATVLINTFFAFWHTLVARGQKLAGILFPCAKRVAFFFMRDRAILNNIVGAQVGSFWMCNLVSRPFDSAI